MSEVKYTPDFQLLVMGDRQMFPINNLNNDSIISNVDILKLLGNVNALGYNIINPKIINTWSKETGVLFLTDFNNFINKVTKSGDILRESFFNEDGELTPHTEEEIKDVAAQYAVTYGWEDTFNTISNETVTEIMSNYICKDPSIPNKTLILNLPTKSKDLKLASTEEVLNLLYDIISSSKVLRKQQIDTLKAAKPSVLVDVLLTRKISIPISENKAILARLIKSEVNAPSIFTSASDVLKYILNTFAYEPLEGQILAADLKNRKLKIPISDRKFIIRSLEEIGAKYGAKFLAEDMFKFETYWKIIDMKLHWEKYDKARIKAPIYSKAIDLIYEGDRSWTFNSRYAIAKNKSDYANAIIVAAERPGFLLRNLIDLIRYKKGDKLAHKQPINKSSTYIVPSNLAKSDANNFINSPEFNKICATKISPKAGFQLIEQLIAPGNNTPQKEKVIQDTTIYYDVPVPALCADNVKAVYNAISEGISTQLRVRNAHIGKVFINPATNNFPIKYSGRKDTSISYSGTFLPKGSFLELNDLSSKYLRLGVMWRGARSTDIDQSVTLITNANEVSNLYFANTSYKNKAGKLIGSASGDITYCADENGPFSVEITDLDLKALKEDGIVELFSSFINYSGSTGIGNLECYIFMQTLDKKDLHKQAATRAVSINLNDTDYAIQIDPDNADKAGSYLGIRISLINNMLEVISEPVLNAKGGRNIAGSLTAFQNIMNNRTPAIALEYAMSLAINPSQITTDINKAEIIISDTKLSDEIDKHIAPSTQFEKIEKLLF